MPEICYRQNAEETIERRRQFAEGLFKRRILFSVSTMRKYPDGLAPKSVRRELHLPEPGTAVDGPAPIERLLPVVDHNLSLLREVRDDSLPITEFVGSFGHAVVCELLGHPVVHHVVGGFGTGSTVTKHLADLADLMSLELQWDHPAAGQIGQYLEKATEYGAGKFYLSPYMAQDGLHLMTQLLGYEQAYVSLIERPQEAHAFCRKAVRIAEDFYEFQLRIIGQVAVGWVCLRLDWNARPCISLNLDDYLACSNEFFQEFGIPYLQELIDHFGTGLMHYHTPDTRLLRDVARLRNIFIQVGGDPRLPEPIECLRAIREATGDIPITWMRIQRDAFEARLKRGDLPGNVEYLVSGVRDSADANRLHDLAVEYEAPELV